MNPCVQALDSRIESYIIVDNKQIIRKRRSTEEDHIPDPSQHPGLQFQHCEARSTTAARLLVLIRLSTNHEKKEAIRFRESGPCITTQ